MKGLAIGATLICLAWTVACAGNLSTSRQYDDAVLASRVQEALQNDPEIGRYEINVNAREGVVTLTGTVATAAAATRAGRIAETIPSVKAVKNLITVGGMGGPVR